jgi:hypothetical protein
MPNRREFFSAVKEIFRSNPDGLREETTKTAGKKADQTVFDGRERRLKG